MPRQVRVQYEDATYHVTKGSGIELTHYAYPRPHHHHDEESYNLTLTLPLSC